MMRIRPTYAVFTEDYALYLNCQSLAILVCRKFLDKESCDLTWEFSREADEEGAFSTFLTR